MGLNNTANAPSATLCTTSTASTAAAPMTLGVFPLGEVFEAAAASPREYDDVEEEVVVEVESDDGAVEAWSVSVLLLSLAPSCEVAGVNIVVVVAVVVTVAAAVTEAAAVVADLDDIARIR